MPISSILGTVAIAARIKKGIDKNDEVEEIVEDTEEKFQDV